MMTLTSGWPRCVFFFSFVLSLTSYICFNTLVVTTTTTMTDNKGFIRDGTHGSHDNMEDERLPPQRDGEPLAEESL